MNIQWQCKFFNDLFAEELYAVMQLRNEVFVIEQNCIYQDADNKDQLSHHLMGWDNTCLISYARLIPPGVAYAEASAGRIVTSPAHRGKGAGKKLISEVILSCYQLFGKTTIKIGAQLYLKKFYESVGFIQTSEVYSEDGILHIQMILRPD